MNFCWWKRLLASFWKFMAQRSWSTIWPNMVKNATLGPSFPPNVQCTRSKLLTVKRKYLQGFLLCFFISCNCWKYGVYWKWFFWIIVLGVLHIPYCGKIRKTTDYVQGFHWHRFKCSRLRIKASYAHLLVFRQCLKFTNNFKHEVTILVCHVVSVMKIMILYNKRVTWQGVKVSTRTKWHLNSAMLFTCSNHVVTRDLAMENWLKHMPCFESWLTWLPRNSRISRHKHKHLHILLTGISNKESYQPCLRQHMLLHH